MRKLLNTLYILSPGRYLSLDGENVVISENTKELGRIPLHNLQGIVTSSYSGASPALMGACAKRGLELTFLSQSGKFLARIVGEVRGNVTLRRDQYRIADDECRSLPLAVAFVVGKVFNARWVLERTRRDYPERIDSEALGTKSEFLKNALHEIRNVTDTASLRGHEGEAASVYFSAFDDLILQQKKDFFFHERSRRPPLDRVNALLSFTYTILAGMCTSALETVGLDPYVGFLHRDRPGRVSLALDLMEEFRAVLADRFVLSLINRKMVAPSDFYEKENGAILMTDECRKSFFAAWHARKQETIIHPFLGEKVEWGLVPYVQALLLARYLRGDLDAYPPFLWK